MGEAYIIDAIRTPAGKKNGALASVHPIDLGASAIRSLLDRTPIDPAAIDDVVFGCVDAIGGQAGNIARTAGLAAGLPEHVPGVTVDRQCGSSQQALHFAAQAVLSGTADLVVAGGVQSMSRIPISAAMTAGRRYGFEEPQSGSAGWHRRYGNEEISQFRAAELIAEKWGISREDMERWALRSHERARTAAALGRFDAEIAPVGAFAADECPRNTSLAAMAALPTLRPGGRVTAALASQICDGASATLVASEAAVLAHGLRPRARIHHLSARGDDPVFMLTAPIPATEHALRRTGMHIDDFDVIEVNEAFASVVLAWVAETGADPDRVNVNGGGIALGHPLGATGTKLFATMLHELERTGGRFGLQTMCEGGGTANVLIVERLD
ncbi:acetyl-CoA C-acetyltransferase [Rhodococcus sp. OK519]|uniref:acetyl-CoA C-acetyltransferase n=1 Tax=Rhodococcus sp. OK519 TaxID=2135729 RepID=UPI000D37D857|nr:acetyl-CoA C-acetyltransferase [Rhodococcus sp. OK519]